MRIIASEYIDLMEKMQLARYPEKRGETGKVLEKRLIWDKFEKGKVVAIDHVKLDGKVISLSEGEIIEEELLNQKLKLDCLSEDLAKKAERVAEELKEKLSR